MGTQCWSGYRLLSYEKITYPPLVEAYPVLAMSVMVALFTSSARLAAKASSDVAVGAAWVNKPWARKPRNRLLNFMFVPSWSWEGKWLKRLVVRSYAHKIEYLFIRIDQFRVCRSLANTGGEFIFEKARYAKVQIKKSINKETRAGVRGRSQDQQKIHE